jgi:hypothetical protein
MPSMSINFLWLQRNDVYHVYHILAHKERQQGRVDMAGKVKKVTIAQLSLLTYVFYNDDKTMVASTL